MQPVRKTVKPPRRSPNDSLLVQRLEIAEILRDIRRQLSLLRTEVRKSRERIVTLEKALARR